MRKNIRIALSYTLVSGKHAMFSSGYCSILHEIVRPETVVAPETGKFEIHWREGLKTGRREKEEGGEGSTER